MRLPQSHKNLAVQPTALEARHFAAAYALYRVCNMRNLHMMMPPTYRDLWKGEFSQLKEEDSLKGYGWMYEADPFTVHQERAAAAAAAAAAAKNNLGSDTQRQKGKEPLVNLGLGSAGQAGGRGKPWTRVPKVDMGDRIRRKVEELVRTAAIWNPYNIEIPEPQRSSIVEEFTRLGFRRSHVEEAASECKDREEVLEWLLIHVPEDDLPKWSLPEGYAAGVTLASSDLAREAKLKRLVAAGYSRDMCIEFLDKNRDGEDGAAESLQGALLHAEDQPTTAGSGWEADETWEEEHFALEAIFGDRYERLSPSRCQVTSEPTYSLHPITFVFQKPSRSTYPDHPPVLLMTATHVPAYIRLSATRQAIQHAQQDLLGSPMIFNLVHWLQDNLPRILEDPGKLRNISVESSPHSTQDTFNKASSTEMVGRSFKRLNLGRGGPQSAEIKAKWEARQSDPKQQKMLSARRSLPAWEMQEAIVETVNGHQVTIISGETGSGKSTQSVQFLLDDLIRRDLGAAANIVCTQPRRISALGLADRVSAERCLTVGDEIGYTVRGDSKTRPGSTKITFMTTGVLLRRMQVGGNDVADSLANITHVVVDEVHERSLDTDILLALMREVLQRRKDLKLVLMSATLDANVFIRYFGGEHRVGQVNISGRTFPVEDLFLDDVLQMTGFRRDRGGYADESEEPETLAIGKSLRDLGMGINYDLIAATVRHIDSQLKGQAGGILIFLPGTMEIERCLGAMRDMSFAYPLPLHASLPPNEQRRVFQPAPSGKRKVVAATNVAETSITIEDIVAVIDTGRVKETRYDPNDNIVRLEETWASQAACKQRRGRAGRVRRGICYKLYTRNAERNMMERPEPEIRRVPLEQLCLTVKAMRGIQDVAAFLSNTLTPPESMAVDGAMELLHRMGALDNNRLTSLGRYISIIPTDLRCAKLMTYGAIFGCMEVCLTIAAILTVKSPFTASRDHREVSKAIRSGLAKGDGDLLADAAAYRQWDERIRTEGYRRAQSWCHENALIPQTLREISSNRAQLLTSLIDVGILPVDYKSSDEHAQSRWNSQGENKQLIRALIAGAFNPQVARIEFPEKKYMASMSGTVELDPEARKIKYFNQENGRVFVHPSSTLFDAQGFSGAAGYVAYFGKMATSKVFIRDLTRMSPLTYTIH
jgi:HrpA-like RNA helicase